MAQIIVGHTNAHSTRIWVRGDGAGDCDVRLSPNNPGSKQQSKRIKLRASKDFSGVAEFENLSPNTTYTIEAQFEARPREDAVGRVCTLPDKAAYDFGFVLSSCNLSVTAINNVLSLGLGFAGIWAANSSLKLPKDRWQGLWRWIPAWVLKVFLWLGGLVQKATGLKQPGPSFLRSPFLKLSAIFEAKILLIKLSKSEQGESDDVIPLSAGDIVTVGGVRSIAASMPEWHDQKDRIMVVVVAQASGPFPGPGAPVKCERMGVLASGAKEIGKLDRCSDAQPWYGRESERLAFFLHAGDQVYYDFPLPARKPEKAQYHLTYRESWFDDDALRYALAHWPHYMTFDDHEFADQFALDFVPPAGSTVKTYLDEGGDAYNNYVHGRNPKNPVDEKRYFYFFSVGAAHFFVLDTRTQRLTGRNGDSSQMIGPEQMDALTQWLYKHSADLKFVVTSVPFVAQCIEDDGKADPEKTWYGFVSQKPDKNPRNDKWSAKPFAPQREAIINFIAEKKIERVVFLTGDVHCCYHASMRIAPRKKTEGLIEIQKDSHPSKYESVIVHELAAGPANQLELGHIAGFLPRCKGVTTEGVQYEIVLDRFHTQANAAMHIAVNYSKRDQIVGGGGRRATPEIVWNVIRTITDCGPEAWSPLGAPNAGRGEPVMADRIVFTPSRTRDELEEWVQRP